MDGGQKDANVLLRGVRLAGELLRLTVQQDLCWKEGKVVACEPDGRHEIEFAVR